MLWACKSGPPGLGEKEGAGASRKNAGSVPRGFPLEHLEVLSNIEGNVCVSVCEGIASLWRHCRPKEPTALGAVQGQERTNI